MARTLDRSMLFVFAPDSPDKLMRTVEAYKNNKKVATPFVAMAVGGWSALLLSYVALLPQRLTFGVWFTLFMVLVGGIATSVVVTYVVTQVRMMSRMIVAVNRGKMLALPGLLEDVWCQLVSERGDYEHRSEALAWLMVNGFTLLDEVVAARRSPGISHDELRHDVRQLLQKIMPEGEFWAPADN
ncbi:MAG TPA: hypothetical protein VFO38_02720 [Candidatus Saccharimonadales bacterium]|nr:hypothetical protein [Candidatus Saccharimonadales bacterium]